MDVLSYQVIRATIEFIYSMDVFHLTSPIDAAYIPTYLRNIFQKRYITISEITTSKPPILYS